MSELEGVLGAIGVRGETRYLTWFGRRICKLSDESAADQLADVLYSWAYTLGRPTPRSEQRHPESDRRWHNIDADSRLLAYWSGWTVLSGSTVGRVGQPTIGMVSDEVDIGSDVTLPLPALSENALPGWLLIRHGDASTNRDGFRVYLNTDPDRLLSKVASLTGFLVDTYPGFAMKFLTSHDHRRRTDSTVIYLPERPTWSVLHEIEQRARPAVLNDSVPMFTRRVAGGIAVAPSPADGRSFGQDVCGRIADFAVGHYRAEGSTGGRLMRAPIPLPEIEGYAELKLHMRPPDAPTRRRKGTSSGSALDDLLRFTSRLHHEALIAGDRVTWLVRDRVGRYRAMGADVYAGYGGPLLALAHATRLTGNRQSRRLLRATARSALDGQSVLSSSGFHDGQPGTAASLAEAAWISGDDEVSSLANRSLERALLADVTSGGWDVISGLGGSVLAFTAAGSLLGVDTDARCQELVHSLAALGRTDDRHGDIRWPTRIDGRARALAGLAHGGTGAALALAVAGEGSGEWSSIVRLSLAFEDRRRRDDRGWRDYRFDGLNRHTNAWCHGAPGIGLGTTAILKHAADPDGTLRSRVQLAARWTAESVQAEHSESGLCHGWSGNALALRIMLGALDQSAAPLPPPGIPERRPPSGSEDISLMTGESGRLVAQLALDGQAFPPLALVLTTRLLRAVATSK